MDKRSVLIWALLKPKAGMPFQVMGGWVYLSESLVLSGVEVGFTGLEDFQDFFTIRFYCNKVVPNDHDQELCIARL